MILQLCHILCRRTVVLLQDSDEDGVEEDAEVCPQLLVVVFFLAKLDRL